MFPAQNGSFTGRGRGWRVEGEGGGGVEEVVYGDNRGRGGVGNEIKMGRLVRSVETKPLTNRH